MRNARNIDEAVEILRDLEAERETKPFDANGRAVRKWVQVPTDGTDLVEIERYVRASFEAAAAGARGR